MNKLLKLITLFSLIALFPNICFATNIPTPKEEIAKGVYVERHNIPEKVDKLFIKVTEKSGDKEYKVFKNIFISEGNEIKEVKSLDIDSDGKNEYLVSMYTGGSGGFYDLAIIKEKEDGKWESIWEDSFSQPNITMGENGNGEIMIEHFEVINDVPQKVNSVIFYENGKVVKH